MPLQAVSQDQVAKSVLPELTIKLVICDNTPFLDLYKHCKKRINNL